MEIRKLQECDGALTELRLLCSEWQSLQAGSVQRTEYSKRADLPRSELAELSFVLPYQVSISVNPQYSIRYPLSIWLLLTVLDPQLEELRLKLGLCRENFMNQQVGNLWIPRFQLSVRKKVIYRAQALLDHMLAGNDAKVNCHNPCGVTTRELLSISIKLVGFTFLCSLPLGV